MRLCAASMMAFIPEAHTLLMVVHGVDCDTPAPRAACLAGAWPPAAEITFPMNTSWTSSADIPALSMAPLIATEPSRVAGTAAKELLNDPIGVLANEAITTSFSAPAVPLPLLYIFRDINVASGRVPVRGGAGGPSRYASP
uniref:Putative secreted protein n=1 Tax=Ixodes ricinus TaxID=34613 RepID=A0A6B0UTB0_IXORI